MTTQRTIFDMTLRALPEEAWINIFAGLEAAVVIGRNVSLTVTTSGLNLTRQSPGLQSICRLGSTVHWVTSSLATAT